MQPTLLVSMAGILVVAIACARTNQLTRTETPRDRSKLAKAADCGFAMSDSSRLMGESEVDVPPRMIHAGPQKYPVEARERGLTGQVSVTYVIDRDGRAVGPSIRIVQASHQIFVPGTVEMIQTSRFSAGAHVGAPVAVCVRQVVNFTIQRVPLPGGS